MLGNQPNKRTCARQTEPSPLPRQTVRLGLVPAVPHATLRPHYPTYAARNVSTLTSSGRHPTPSAGVCGCLAGVVVSLTADGVVLTLLTVSTTREAAGLDPRGSLQRPRTYACAMTSRTSLLWSVTLSGSMDGT